MKKIWLILMTVLGFAVPIPAFSHAMLKSTLPLDKSILTHPPKTIDLNFGHITKLTNLKLVSPDQELVLINSEVPQLSAHFNVAVPNLKPDTYHVKWSTLSEDGHVMTGHFTFTVKAK